MVEWFLLGNAPVLEPFQIIAQPGMFTYWGRCCWGPRESATVFDSRGGTDSLLELAGGARVNSRWTKYIRNSTMSYENLHQLVWGIE